MIFPTSTIYDDEDFKPRRGREKLLPYNPFTV